MGRKLQTYQNISVMLMRKDLPERWAVWLVGLLLASLLLSACGEAKDSQQPLAATSQSQLITSTSATTRIAVSTEKPSPVAGSDTLYVVDSNAQAESDTVSTVLAVNTISGKVVKRFPTRYRPLATLSPDGRYLYVVDSYVTRVVSGDFVNAVTAIDTRTGERLWETNLPNQRQIYMSVPDDGVISTSEDGAFLYIQFNPQSLITVSTVTHQILKENKLGSDCERFWQTESNNALVGFCKSQVVGIETSTGKQLYNLPLPELLASQSSSPAEVYGVAMARSNNQLYLLNKQANLFTVNLNSPTAAQKIPFSLPSGKQLPTFGSIAVSPNGKSLFVAVRSTNSTASDPGWGPMADGLVIYDTNNWQVLVTLQLSQPVYKLNFSRDGQWLYALNPARKAIAVIDTQKLSEVKVINDLGNLPGSVITA